MPIPGCPVPECLKPPNSILRVLVPSSTTHWGNRCFAEDSRRSWSDQVIRPRSALYHLTALNREINTRPLYKHPNTKYFLYRKKFSQILKDIIMPSCGSDTCSCGDDCGCAAGACDCVCLSSLPVSHTSRHQMWLTKFAEVTVTSQADKCAHRVLPL